MLSITDELFQTLTREAKDRGVNVQMLLRAVVIPEWTRSNLLGGPSTAVDTSKLNSKMEQPVLSEIGIAHNSGRTVDGYRALYFRTLRR